MADTLHLSRSESLRKAELVSILARHLSGPSHLPALEHLLSTRQWKALAYPKLANGAFFLSALAVRLRQLGAKPDEVTADLQGIVLRGVVYFVEQLGGTEKLDVTRNQLSTRRYLDLQVMAVPGAFAMASRLAGNDDSFHWLARPPAQSRLSDFAEIQRDAYVCLRAADDRQIRVTSRGVPHKVDTGRLAALATGQKTVSRPGRAKKTASVPVPPRLWFTLAILIAGSLVHDPENVLLTTDDVQLFLRLPVEGQARRLYSGWLECGFSEFLRIDSLVFTTNFDREVAWLGRGGDLGYSNSDVPPLDRLVSMRQVIVQAITAAAANRPRAWLSVRALMLSVEADAPGLLIPPRPVYGYYSSQSGGRARFYEGIRRATGKYPESQLQREGDWNEVEGAYIAQVLVEPLFWLGLVDLGLAADGKLESFRLTDLGRNIFLEHELPAMQSQKPAGPQLVVQPNYELIVLDATTNLATLSRLDDFAERLTLDRAATYRLTRDSLVRGLDKGLAGADLLDFLERESRAPVPQNVRYSVEEWVRAFERIHVRRGAHLLVAETSSELDRWFADEQIGKLLGERLSPTVALARSVRRETLESLLTKRGHEPRTVDYQRPRSGSVRVVQPDIIDLDRRRDEPYVRYRLGQFASAESVAPGHDKHLRFRISAESIQRSVNLGSPAQSIITYLEGISGGVLPAEMKLRIRGWSGQYSKGALKPVVAISCPIELAWEDLLVVPEVKQALVMVPDPDIGLFRPELVDSMVAALAGIGIKIEPGDLPKEGWVAEEDDEDDDGKDGGPDLASLREILSLSDLIGLGQKRFGPPKLLPGKPTSSLFSRLLGTGKRGFGGEELATEDSVNRASENDSSIAKNQAARDQAAKNQAEPTMIRRDLEDRKAPAVPTSGSITGPGAGSKAQAPPSIKVKALPLGQLREFLSSVLASSQRVIIAQREDGGALYASTMNPRQLARKDSEECFIGFCEDCGYNHTIALADIVGVALAEKSSSV